MERLSRLDDMCPALLWIGYFHVDIGVNTRQLRTAPGLFPTQTCLSSAGEEGS